MATPGQLLNIGTGNKQNRFELQTAFLGDGAITTVSVATLAGGYTNSSVFKNNADNSGVVCAVQEGAPLTSVDAGGARTELREMALDGTTLMAFDPTTQTHWVRGSSRVTAAPDGHLNGCVVAQMHDSSDDNIEICTQLSGGVIKLLCRINGTSIGIPVLSQLYQTDINTPGPWFDWKIEVGSFGYRVYYNDMVNAIVKSTDPGMPALTITGAGSCYFKAGIYTQCKDTDIVDPNRFCSVELRNLMHFHTGWPDPSTVAARVVGPVSNIRAGASVTTANTGATSGTPLTITSTAAFPTGSPPVDNDLLLIVARAWRSNGANNPSTPALDTATAAQGWTRKSVELINIPTAAAPTATNTVTHSYRHVIWYLWYTSGMAAPIITLNSGSATDVFSVQLLCMTGAFQGGDPFDQYGTLTAAAAASTTVIGPAPALASPVPAGSAVFALLDHENALSSGAIPTVTGDGLTWVEGLEFTGVTPAAGAWATDWALVPAQTTVTAKQATIATTSGKGVGQMFSIKQNPPVSNLKNRLRSRNRPMLVR